MNLHTATLLNLCISSNSLFFFRFSRIFCHLLTEVVLLLPSFHIMLFICFSCLSALARTSQTILNKTGRSRYHCLVPDLRVKSILSFTIKYDASCRVFINAFLLGWESSFLLIFLCVNYEKILSNVFFVSINMILNSNNNVYYINWFSDVKKALNLFLDLTWSWWIILFICCWIYLYSWDVCLWFSFLRMSLYGFGIRENTGLT